MLKNHHFWIPLLGMARKSIAQRLDNTRLRSCESHLYWFTTQSVTTKTVSVAIIGLLPCNMVHRLGKSFEYFLLPIITDDKRRSALSFFPHKAIKHWRNKKRMIFAFQDKGLGGEKMTFVLILCIGLALVLSIYSTNKRKKK